MLGQEFGDTHQYNSLQYSRKFFNNEQEIHCEH